MQQGNLVAAMRIETTQLEKSDSLPAFKDRLFNVHEAAAFLGLAVGTVYHMVSEKRIPFIRLSKRCLRFSHSEIMAWIENKSTKEKATNAHKS